jgi:hypothetical protein
MASALDRLEHVHPEDRAAWRAWLVANMLPAGMAAVEAAQGIRANEPRPRA